MISTLFLVCLSHIIGFSLTQYCNRDVNVTCDECHQVPSANCSTKSQATPVVVTAKGGVLGGFLGFISFILVFATLFDIYSDVKLLPETSNCQSGSDLLWDGTNRNSGQRENIQHDISKEEDRGEVEKPLVQIDRQEGESLGKPEEEILQCIGRGQKNPVEQSDEGESKAVSEPCRARMRTSTGIVNTQMSELVQKFGHLSRKKRFKMLLVCGQKAKTQENRGFGPQLKRALEEFVHAKINAGCATYKELCREVVHRIPEDKWMRFVRMYLNLDEAEIQKFRREHATLSEEQRLLFDPEYKILQQQPTLFGQTYL